MIRPYPPNAPESPHTVLTIGRRGLLAASAGLLLSACRVIESPFSGTYKIGLVAPFSGRDNPTGYNLLFAVKLAIKEMNEQGGINGWRVELLAHDDRNDATNGLTQARKLTIDPDVVAVIGHPSSASAIAAAPEYRRAGVPLLTMATADSVTGSGVFRIGPSDAGLADLLVDFAPTKFRAVRLALVSGDPASGKLAERIAKVWWEDAGEVVFGDGLPRELTDFGPIAERILASRPQLVFYAGGIEAGGPLYAEIRRLAPGLPYVVSPLAATITFARLSAGSPTDFAYLITPALDPVEIPAAARYVNAFRASWGVDPWPHSVVAYDAVQLIFEAIRRSDGGRPTRESVLAGLTDGTEYAGLSGAIRFTVQGERERSTPAVYRLVGPRFPGERQT